ncbi:hypothetical protein PBAL39_25075 [Pedobacter sp. BAL39]|uniref:ligand-binding sensor domain-containing protein n=1 Tax=Pedobacter sp. BAL39 TaxID=391596 RepID=UPI000155A10A|nr:sensor histidine kinase [Pedobacter sp. BAL39]EDM36601.1 hypothetical protein PBAL39_25075 [Pedobacter sp. BAL39]
MDKSTTTFLVHHNKNYFIVFLLSLISLSSFAQRYSFKQFDVEDGLTQSQVTGITQDSKRRLWVSTLGGLGCFSGKQFCSFTKTSGLNSNFALAITADKKDNIWVGTSRGISAFNGKKILNHKQTTSWVGNMTTASSGLVYGISSSQLFRTDGMRADFIKVTRDQSEMVTAVKKDANGKLWAAVYHHGLFSLENGSWIPSPVNHQIKEALITDLIADSFIPDKLWVLTDAGLLMIQEKKVILAVQTSIKLTAIEQDARGNIWLGSGKGAYCLSAKGILHFTANNGFTDNTVNAIFRDAENNIWLGTDGEGLFRFNDTNYFVFDESQGLSNRVVMSLAKGPSLNEVWIGTYRGLFKFKNNKITQVLFSKNKENNNNINFLYNDSKQQIWIGTVSGGLWLYDGKKFRNMTGNQTGVAYNAVLEDSRKRIWLSTNMGCFLLDQRNGKMKWISREFGSTLMESDEGNILVGTQDGLYIIDENKKSVPLKIKGMENMSILCMTKMGSNLFFGTSDNGIFCWNEKTARITRIGTREGLASDHVYSMLIDPKGILWAGSGKGINMVDVHRMKVLREAGEHSLLVECNQNAILRDREHIWIGTTKGAIVYHSDQKTSKTTKPFIYLNTLKAFSQYRNQKDSLRTVFHEKELKKVIRLPHDQNNLSIDFTGIFLSNPEALMYEYKLTGGEGGFTETISNPSMNFTALPPGKYTFQVRAVTKSGIKSSNSATVTFEITPPYYQTSFFRLFAFFVIILVILAAVYTILTLKERKRKLRLKIKLEEQVKVRKQTAEDFHDDLGNKLTRISVLSEVLCSMISEEDLEKRAIIGKINENVNDLYNGTRDILWSLNPKNDLLSQLIAHIISFGWEMFNNTAIEFEEDIDLGQFDGKLSLDISRNLLMIFKEAIHNVLKHSKATKVTFTAIIHNELLEIRIKDNGMGISGAATIEGHGINNMKVRARRISARLNIRTADQGTALSLQISLKTLMRLKNV